MNQSKLIGPLIQSFFIDHLVTVKGLRPASVRSYRDTIRMLLEFVAKDNNSRITKLTVGDLTFERVVGFLRYLEDERGNHVRTRNQRLAAVHTLFDYIGGREPEMLGVCQRVTAIPMKRATPAQTCYLERDETEALFRALPRHGSHALRDRALLLFLYNTGARAQETADVHIGDLDLAEPALVRLHGKGDKWRTCPLWQQTAELLKQLLEPGDRLGNPDMPVFVSTTGAALTRSGIYKIVRRHASHLDDPRTGRRISPHIFRHYVDGWVMWPAGVFPLVAGVDGVVSGHITRGLSAFRLRGVELLVVDSSASLIRPLTGRANG